MNTTQLEKFFERSKSEMEGRRGFQTNHQDGNNVVTDGTRNTPKEDINLSLDEVCSFLALNEGRSGNHLIFASANDSSEQVQPVNSGFGAADPSPKPSTGDELSTEEDETLEVSLAPQNDQVFKRGKTEHAIQGSWTKPPEEVAEEGPSQSSEVPNKMVMSSSAKPSTSKEESEEEKSLQKQRVCYKLHNAAGADQVSNNPVSVVAPLNAGATGDVDHEENAEPPVPSGSKSSGNGEKKNDRNERDINDEERVSQHFCGICQEAVLVNKCCQRAAHEGCLSECDSGLTNCNCFQRERAVERNNFPAAPASPPKQPSGYEDVSHTSEYNPLQTFLQHPEVFFLICFICGKKSGS